MAVRKVYKPITTVLVDEDHSRAQVSPLVRWSGVDEVTARKECRWIIKITKVGLIKRAIRCVFT